MGDVYREDDDASHEDDGLPPVAVAGLFAETMAHEVRGVLDLPLGGRVETEIEADDVQLSSGMVQNPIKFSHELAWVYLNAAGECLHTLGRLLREPTPPFIGTASVARTALEHAAKSWWLQRPEDSGRKRAGRAFGAMRETSPSRMPTSLDHRGVRLVVSWNAGRLCSRSESCVVRARSPM